MKKLVVGATIGWFIGTYYTVSRVLECNKYGIPFEKNWSDQLEKEKAKKRWNLVEKESVKDDQS